jgi:hypothetical protein
MNFARFKELVDAYGGDPKRWPAAERAAAEDFAARDPAARAALDEAARLDALLDAMTVKAPAVDPARIAAAASAAAQEPAGNVVPLARARKAPRPALARWGRGAALAAATVAGFVIGMGEIDGQGAAVGDASPLDLFNAVQAEDTLW